MSIEEKNTKHYFLNEIYKWVNLMLKFSPEELTDQEKKKFLIGSIIPRPIALVSTMSNMSIVNIAPFSYFNIESYDPPILAVSLQRVEGQLKDTAKNLFKNKEAVIHIVDEENVESTTNTSAPLERDESELDISGFTKVDAKTIRVLGVKETKVRYETELYNSMIIYNDKNQPAADMILLKVKHYHIDEAIYEDGYIDPVKLNAVSRLAGNDYAEIGKMFTIKRP